MAVAMVQEFTVAEGERSTTNYDAVKEQLRVEADPPAGMIFHTAGFTGKGVFRIFDVWESLADWERFRDERLVPAVEARSGGTAAPPDIQYSYQLHDFVRG
jgi:hypothetical protein